MKFIIILLISLLYEGAIAQRLPTTSLKNLKGQTVLLTDYLEPNRPTIISFWATWCKPCLQELKAINENLKTWEKETSVKLIAISVDDARSKNRVPSFVNARKWNFDVLIDENGDLQRAMNVLNVPHTFILDRSGKIIFQHSSYAVGDEKEYIKMLKK